MNRAPFSRFSHKFDFLHLQYKGLGSNATASFAAGGNGVPGGNSSSFVIDLSYSAAVAQRLGQPGNGSAGDQTVADLLRLSGLSLNGNACDRFSSSPLSNVLCSVGNSNAGGNATAAAQGAVIDASGGLLLWRAVATACKFHRICPDNGGAASCGPAERRPAGQHHRQRRRRCSAASACKGAGGSAGGRAGGAGSGRPARPATERHRHRFSTAQEGPQAASAKAGAAASPQDLAAAAAASPLIAPAIATTFVPAAVAAATIPAADAAAI